MAKCKYWKTCKYYDEESTTCNYTDGFYGERLAACYIKNEDKT